MNTELMRMRLRMAEALTPTEMETIVHGEGRTSTLRGDIADRERLRAFVLEHRGRLYGRQRFIPADSVEIR